MLVKYTYQEPNFQFGPKLELREYSTVLFSAFASFVQSSAHYEYFKISVL